MCLLLRGVFSAGAYEPSVTVQGAEGTKARCALWKATVCSEPLAVLVSLRAQVQATATSSRGCTRSQSRRLTENDSSPTLVRKGSVV